MTPPPPSRRCQRQHDEGEESIQLSSTTTVGDNLCQWHKHSLLLVAELPESDLIYAQFHNRFSLVPYCIVLDHASQSVIISIRGSLSLEDLVTDVMIDPEHFSKTLVLLHGWIRLPCRGESKLRYSSDLLGC